MFSCTVSAAQLRLWTRLDVLVDLHRIGHVLVAEGEVEVDYSAGVVGLRHPTRDEHIRHATVCPETRSETPEVRGRPRRDTPRVRGRPRRDTPGVRGRPRRDIGG